ncbi:VanZ family protein [Nocardioides yefusunii]|uniref:VanZ family protein n=1 Tax=Nocardioides yefusunii TaxID=2500546 RepID=A0ABW1QX15_9ACTN|nr:VanZ family protein [Nocardioides yefusunii]
MVLVGVQGMLVGVAASGVLALLVAWVLVRLLPPVSAWAWALLVFAVLCIGVITLTPAYAVPEVIPADARPTRCSMDYGGPAPEGFWVVAGNQRLLNVAIFVPAGFLLVLALGRWRAAWVLAPLGLLGLAAYSVAIEWVQFEVARIDRACDVTDMVDNTVGAALGFVVGLLALLLVRPWRAPSVKERALRG